MIFPLVFYRLKEVTGEIDQLPYLSGKMIKEFAKSHENTVMLFSDRTRPLHFVKFALEFYKSNVTFARASERDGKGYKCTSFPCIFAFKNGRRIIDSEPVPSQAINFTRWVKYIFENNDHSIEHPEVLRRLLASKQTCVISIGNYPRPKFMNKDMHFYQVNPSVFKLLNMEVKEGLYSYTALARILHEIKDSNHDFNTYVQNFDEKEYFSKKYFGGFVLQTTDNPKCQLEFDIMNKLGKKYEKEISFAPIYGKVAFSFLENAKIHLFDTPMFVVFETDGIFSNRYTIINQTLMHDYNYIDQFVGDIVSGKKNYTVHSEILEPTKNKYLKPISYESFWPTLNMSIADTVVYFYSGQCEGCLKMRLVINRTASLLRENNIKFYTYNLSLNEMPSNLELGRTIPQTYLFRHNKLQKPLLYDGLEIVGELIAFLKEQGTERLDVPSYSEKKIRKEIADEYSLLSEPVELHKRVVSADL
ncbi:hypothetical protein TVAG_493020 [Trichomonas vaginalis G3]|uniref:protein disulfide-isomerase n=1 Tax=Trichomonas vaginalis (strain ATCC PRA-98 / G3) TaxID=412133 RepID=A2FUU5_TRIV3|nr:protein disulfide isomerase family [Trichomonas vaginalis G3]EAX91334.1 hypothetical protein TVAG_493020 [Trichomonas vaginalis G3]KAI5547557.1 protein disulfide isomerase family [Trichomonas vaginalis G3]|eukprot:XP_001304264.1 hypothetical protein [Trichomonas vaginalis G3]